MRRQFAVKFGKLHEKPCLHPARLVGWSFSSDMECQYGSVLQSWCENNCSGPECVAPTVLRNMAHAVPSPSGLGYVVARLRRSGFFIRALARRLCGDEFVDVGCTSRLMVGDWSLKVCDLRVATQRWRRERSWPGPEGLGPRQGRISSAVGAANASAGKSHDLRWLSGSHPDS